MGTYVATPTVTYNTYYNNAGYTDGMKQGMVYTSETKTVSPYNAWRSLVWFDGAAISAALVGQRVTAVGLNAVSANDQIEDINAIPIRLYRTNLSYSAGNAGKNSANTNQFTAGMTYENPFNDYMLAYGETEALARGGTLSNAIFMTGQAAIDFVSALALGYAMGNFVLASGASYTGRALIRFLSSVTLTITYELDNADVTKPSVSVVTTPKISLGGTGNISFSGAGATSDSNPIIGYAVRCAESTDGGTTWGDWSAAVITSMTDSSGILSVTTGAAGTTRKYQIATVGQLNTSAYADVTGTITVCPIPSAPVCTYALCHCLLQATATVAASLTDELQYVYAQVDGGPATLQDVVPASGGVSAFSLLLSAGTHIAAIQVYDAYGVAGTAATLSLTAAALDAGSNCMTFKGISSAALGLAVTTFPQPVNAAERVTRETLTARAGDVSVFEGDDVRAAYDWPVVLYAADDTALGYVRAWLSGSGDLIIGDDAQHVMDAEITNTLEMERFSSGGGRLITATFHVQPFRRRVSDATEAIEYNRAGTIVNNGDAVCYPLMTVYATGDVTLTVGSHQLTIPGVVGSAVIDGWNMTVTDPDGNLVTTASGRYPELAVGANPVAWSDTVEKVVVNRRRRYR